MISARASSTRITGTLHSAMAPQQRRLPTAGKIRPGIKVLTKAAIDSIKGAQQIYSDGIAAGASFDDIEKSLKAAGPKFTRSPLAPKNAPYFRVCQDDFTAPGAAALIMDTYGEQRPGDAAAQLYSFPVVFPSDDLDLIFRESFEAWRASELYRWSEPDAKTGTLQCMMRQAVDAKAKRRQFGGRPIVVEKPCNPNSCDLFGAGHCKHVGSLYFWIPGILGIGLIELTFTSIYASMDVAEKIELVQRGLGHVKGTHNGHPIFRVCKTLDNVARINWETGKPERSTQWIIRLEADLDMVEVLAGKEQPMLAAPARAPALADPPAEKTVSEQPAEEPAEEPEEPPAADQGPEQGIAYMRKQVSAALKTLTWPPDEFQLWLEGNGFAVADMHNAERLELILAELKKLVAAQEKRSETAGAAEPAEDVPF